MDSERHVPFDDLTVWSLGGLSEQRRQEIATHLATNCERCLADLLWFQQTMRIARGDRLQAPPPAVLHSALRIFREQPRAPGNTSIGLPRLVGRLLFDSATSPRMVGMRGAAHHGRQMLYAVEPLDLRIDLRVEREEPLVHLAGQILHVGAPAEPALPQHIAVESPAGDSEVSLFSTGEFAATFKDGGPHTLVLRIADQEVALAIAEWIDGNPADR